MTEAVEEKAWSASNGRTASGRSSGARGDDHVRTHSPPKATRVLAGSVLTKLLIFPLTSIFSIMLSRLLVRGLGVDGYAIASIILSLPALVPISDLGYGAAITNASGNLARNPVELAAVWRRAMRALLALSAVAVAASFLGGGLSIWHLLLPTKAGAESVDWAIALSIAMYAITLPLALGGRVLIGSGRTRHLLWVQALANPTSFLAALGAIALGQSLPFVIAAVMLGPIVAASVALILGLPTVRKSQDAARSGVLKAPRAPMGALSMLVITMMIPVALQSDRWLLGAVGSSAQVAQYSGLMIGFTPALALIQSGNTAMWGHFAENRDQAPSRDEFRKLLVAATLLGAGAAAGYMLIAPFIMRWVLGPGFAPSIPEVLSFALLLLLMASHLPAGALLTTPPGLRFQAVGASLMAVTSVGLTITFIPAMGVAGPVLASCIAVALTMFIPCLAKAWFIVCKGG